MPQTDTGIGQSALRALIPLSLLPLQWKDLNDEAIAGHLASALVEIADADFSYVLLTAYPRDIELAWGPEGRVPATLTLAIRASLLDTPTERASRVQSAISGETVTVFSAPLRLHGASKLVVASKRSDYPTEIDKFVVRMAANEATAALDRLGELTIAKYLAKLVNQSSSFIGVVDLQGMPIFVNPAGLELVGMSGIQEALEVHVVDFLDFSDRDRARHRIWPAVLSEGGWRGQLSFLNAKTGVATPLLVECFRIEIPSSEVVAVGTISIDARDWTVAECELHRQPDAARTRQATLAGARVKSLSGRERQVLHALVAGRSHKVMAHELGISVRTIEVHRSRMMRRLGVRTLAEAIKLAVVSGTVE